MSTSQTSTPARQSSRQPGADSLSAARVRIVQAALTLGSLAVIGYLIVRPGPDRNDFTYGAFAASRDAAWAGWLVDCIGYGVASFALALAACIIVRRRGAAWATTGAVLVAVGGVLFSAAAYAFGTLGWYVTATGAIPADSGTALMTYVEANLGHLVAADVAGFLLLTLGSLLIAVGLWRCAAVPRWLPVALAVTTVAQFGPWTPRLLDVVQILVMASFIAIAWFTGRATADAS